MCYTYIYECELLDKTLIITTDINEIVDTINELKLYKPNKLLNTGIIYNYIYRNKTPKFMKSITKTKRNDYFKDKVDNDYLEDKSLQTKNKFMREEYKKFKTEMYNDKIKKEELEKIQKEVMR